MANLDVGVIGYGEVGKIFSNALRAKGALVGGCWDVKFADALMGGAQRLHRTGARCGRLRIGAICAARRT